ncbi:hypothetical protein B0H16DRAFT_1900457 [Mycena metata]|uniref:Uncharacterized protein n=1 Tax=Mycena metata TaxID=1033252 RepID=A0AAD7MDD1_9AGAR|nr:hypothetical protein B0H16DRAFT_1900457 [Mycena metata]
MTSSSLIVGDILAALFSRGRTQDDDEQFHWTICLPTTTTTAKKLHAKGVTATNFIFESPPCRYSASHVPNSIGTLNNQNAVDAVIALLATIPLVTPPAEAQLGIQFNCLVWFRQAVRCLHDNGYLHCPDVGALEAECRKYGEANDASFGSWKGYMYFVAESSK